MESSTKVMEVAPPSKKPTSRASRHAADSSSVAAPVTEQKTKMKSKRTKKRLVEVPNLFAPMQSDRFLMADYSEKIEELIESVRLLERLAFYNPQTGTALEILTITRDFLSLLIDLLILRRAFEKSPRRSIEGTAGVSTILGVSKATVHLRLNRLGLESDDFRDPERTLDYFINSSKPLLDHIERLNDLRRKYSPEIDELPDESTSLPKKPR